VPIEVGCGEGVFPSPLGEESGTESAPPQKFFLVFGLKMVKCGVF